MEKLPPFDRPTLRHHRQQRFWQIQLPIVLVSLLIGAAGGYTILAEGAQDRLWADISTIWLVAPMLFFALFLLAVLVGMIYLLYRLTKATPIFTRRVQNLFLRIEKEARRAADSAVKPVLWIHQFQSGLKYLLGRVKPVKK
ncbi:MAG: hypothetical protein A2X25_04935 [Chloroflexi bacterium GWB2_49_20]|nr:MAG: hypothetical protein A2X25_04935 [Chloroflexi bacterium GWB2_49_20]OGN80529.1 MAG: hypothetical protein A2X26_12045 [Chloroflexi bacterium GWC2_49_37]OGN83364.1 MAG: hypothetical protein A2X27_12220 [Chloroflexi bacterium GWD2_49_16]HCC78145.1 hypothetical protein [Anaerolineae bacterium]